MEMNSERRVLREPDVLIIGGGIVGCAIFRECATNGLSVQIVERKDFGWDVSAGSTEMAHGGFRYLMAIADWPLVFESLTERELLNRNAPHLVRHLNFYMPLYVGDGMAFDFCVPGIPKMNVTVGKYLGFGMWMMQAGMMLYKYMAVLGLLAKGFAPNMKQVGYRKYTSRGMLGVSPQLNPERLVGGFRFTDCKIEDVERLVIENILAGNACAEKNGTPASALNYTEAVEIARGEGGKIENVAVRDGVSGRTEIVRPKLVVNATGVLIDATRKKFGLSASRLLRTVSGIHIIAERFLKSEDRREAYAFWIDRKILFAISKGTDRMLIGTTERDVETEGGDYNKTFADDVDQIIRKTKSRFPEFRFRTGEDIYYTRVRPLMYQPSKSDPKAVSRRDLIKWHDDVPNMVSVSGKLGPSRHLAEMVGKKIVDTLRPGKMYIHTHKTSLPGGAIEGDFEKFIENECAAHPDVDRRMITNLVRRLGARYVEALESVKGPEDMAPIGTSPDALPHCVLLLAFKREFAVTMHDAMTRTGNTKFFGEGLDCIEKATAYVGMRLGWDSGRVQNEIDEYRKFINSRRELVGELKIKQ